MRVLITLSVLLFSLAGNAQLGNYATKNPLPAIIMVGSPDATQYGLGPGATKLNYTKTVYNAIQAQTELLSIIADLRKELDSIKRDFDPIKYYDRNGRARFPTKIFRDTFVITNASSQTINISSPGFTNVRSVSASVMQNTSTANTAPSVYIKSYTNSSVTLAITQPKPQTLSATLFPISLAVDISQYHTSPGAVTVSISAIGD